MTTVESTIIADDWLAISTDGFAAQNEARDPAHLSKEIIQNALDAVQGLEEGCIDLWIVAGPDGTQFTCTDNGPGLEDIEKIRTMFYTSKTDSHLMRGRFGRGFKEMLCPAIRAEVVSRSKRIAFTREDGKRIVRVADEPGHGEGTVAFFLMPWPERVVDALTEYFSRFLLPDNVVMTVNDTEVGHAEPSHIIEASLTTETFDGGKWRKPSKNTCVELYPVRDGDTPFIYEMGIPVCPIEWSVDYHANVLQRVPMNPNRDAVMSGYLTKVHRACLPVLLDELDPEQVQSEWVGTAGEGMDDDLQKKIIGKAFGETAVRAVPVMGKRDANDEAEESGHDIVRTNHLPRGFREMTRRHMPTATEAVDADYQRKVEAAAGSVVDIQKPRHDVQAELIESNGGAEHVQRVCDYALFICDRILGYVADNPFDNPVTVEVALLRPANASATWSAGNVLTLGLDEPFLWRGRCINATTSKLLIHEAAHAFAMHHGRNFKDWVEKLGGIAMMVAYENHDEVVARWGDLMDLNEN